MKLDNSIHVGDRVQVKPKEELPDEMIGVSDNINGSIGFITQIIEKKYECHYKVNYPIGQDMGLTIIVTERQLEKAFNIRNCTLFKALDSCGECETRFYCYTNKWGTK